MSRHDYVLDDILTDSEQCVLFYLEDNAGTFISPTEIGREVGGGDRHSSWGSPKCQKLVEYGFAERNNRGHYKYIH
jgi:hypothetical protein